MNGPNQATLIVNEALMIRTRFPGTLLLVEGSDDSRLYKKVTDQQVCRIIPCKGRVYVIQAVADLAKRGVNGILGIVDADFAHLKDVLSVSPNILFTDSHDLETLLLSSPALEGVLTEKADDEKLETLVTQWRGDIRNLLLTLSSDLGYLRLLSSIKEYNLTFDGLSFSSFIKRDTLHLDLPTMLKTVRDKSQRHDLGDQRLLQELDGLRSKSHDLWQVCCGHDMVSVLNIALLKVLGNHGPKEITPEILEALLRTSYPPEHFPGTKLYHAIKEWEQLNPLYRVLKA